MQGKMTSLHAVLKALSDDEVSRSVVVSNIPSETKEEAIIIHFQKRRHGGGDVSWATLVDQNKAVLTFDDPETVKTVLSIEQKIGEMVLTVKQCPARRQKGAGGVFKQVTATLDPHKLNAERADARNLLTRLKEKTGITIDEIDGDLTITGSLLQINECHQLLLQDLIHEETEINGVVGVSSEAETQTGNEQGIGAVAHGGARTKPDRVSKPNGDSSGGREDKVMSNAPAAVTSSTQIVEGASGPHSVSPWPEVQIINTDPVVAKYIMHVYRDRVESLQQRYGVRLLVSIEYMAMALQPLDGCGLYAYNAAWNDVLSLLTTASKGMTSCQLELNHTNEESLQVMVRQIQTRYPVLIERNREAGSLVVYGDVASVERAEEMVQVQKEWSQRNSQMDSPERVGESASHVLQEPSPVPSIEVFKIQTKHGVTVSLHYGDITEEKVDAIVNPANRNLVHGAGLAYFIARKGGQEIDRESAKIVNRHGKIPVGEVTCTNPGLLPCRCIIHAVAPEWGNQRPKDSRRLLEKVSFESLQLASKLGLTSIALPAISSGVFRFPLAECASAMVKAVQNYLQVVNTSKKEAPKKADDKKSGHNAQVRKSSDENEVNKKKGDQTEYNEESDPPFKGGISDIRFVFIDAEAMDVFEKEFQKRFGVKREEKGDLEQDIYV